MRLLLIALAGSVGALCRYGIGVWVGPRSFPWSTMAINVTGSFLLGLVLTMAVARGWPTDVTAPIAVGFLGAFTTFSAFSWESLTLARSDDLGLAALYVGLSVALGFAAAAAGLRLGEAVTG